MKSNECGCEGFVTDNRYELVVVNCELDVENESDEETFTYTEERFDVVGFTMYKRTFEGDFVAEWYPEPIVMTGRDLDLLKSFADEYDCGAWRIVPKGDVVDLREEAKRNYDRWHEKMERTAAARIARVVQ